LWARWLKLWQQPAAAWAAFAPHNLVQPILPSATFGNVISITERNSSSPAAEYDITAKESYGRQLGKVMDALAVLIKERPAGAGSNPVLDELLALRTRIEQLKEDSLQQRAERLKADLLRLKQKYPEKFREIAAVLTAE
jgi:hypothetical protein